jgi:HEAT repeat protein
MRLKEDKYPVDEHGKPDLSYYRDPLAYYIQMYEQHLDTLEGRKTGPGYEVELSFQRRVHAIWGLVAKGVEAAPYALSLLQRREPEAREDGASILSELGKDNGVVDALLHALNAETDLTARDSIVMTLGRLKSRKAIPALAVIIRDVAQDHDTRWTAAESLGTIVRRRFFAAEDPIEAAIAWLTKHPESTTQN